MTIAHYSSSCAYSLLHACTWAGGSIVHLLLSRGRGWKGADVLVRRGEGDTLWSALRSVVVVALTSIGRCADQ